MSLRPPHLPLRVAKSTAKVSTVGKAMLVLLAAVSSAPALQTQGAVTSPTPGTSSQTPAFGASPIPDAPAPSPGTRRGHSRASSENSPDLPGSLSSGSPHAGGAGMEDGAMHEPREINWSRFFTDAARSGFRFAEPRFSGAGSTGDGGQMWGNAAGGMGGGAGMSSRSEIAGMGGGHGRIGGSSMFDLGGGLLHSMAQASGSGALGDSLKTFSHLSQLQHGGISIPGKPGGIDFHVSSSLGNMFGGGVGQMLNGGGGERGGSGFSAMGMGGDRSFGAPGGMGVLGSGGPHGGGGKGAGPQVSLRIKF